jgi:hypothetical protein
MIAIQTLSTMKRKSKKHFEESAISVPCPRRLQRQILRNLTAASKSKLNPWRAKRAAEILAAIEAEANVTAPTEQSNQIPVKALVSIRLPQPSAPAVEITKKHSMYIGFCKCVQRVVAFVKRNFFFRLVYSG